MSLCPPNMVRGGDGAGMHKGVTATGSGGCFGPNLTHCIPLLCLSHWILTSGIQLSLLICKQLQGMLVCEDDIPG